MFRKTDKNPQLDLFTSPGSILPKRAQKKYLDDKAWHNQFFNLVTSQIDEEAFKPLFLVLYREPGTDNLKVTVAETGEVIEAVYVGGNKRVGKHWRVNLPDVKQSHPWRYFNEEEVRRSELRRKIESLPIEEQNKKNNIEAAMFQYSFHTRNGKTRYRGLFRHHIQAFHRCMWMNLRRLALFQTTSNQGPLTDSESSLAGKTFKVSSINSF